LTALESLLQTFDSVAPMQRTKQAADGLWEAAPEEIFRRALMSSPFDDSLARRAFSLGAFMNAKPKAVPTQFPAPEGMRLPRRNFLRLIGGSAAFPAITHGEGADTYPARPVHLIVGFPPGGATDATARLVGQALAERLGQPFVIENRPGASGNIGAEAVAKAPPDGYSLLLVASAHAINMSFYEKVSFDFMRDIAPVAGLVAAPLVMVVNPAFPARTVAEFIAYARANPGKLNMASPGNGTSPHVAGEQFKMMTGIDMLHVPFRGGQLAQMELMAGRVDVLFGTMLSNIEHIRAGKLRILAVTGEARSAAMPDVPTVSESVPGYEASDWYGIGAPRRTPAEIVEKLNREVRTVLGDSRMRTRFADMGATVLATSPADFGKLIAAESVKWAKVVKFAGVKAD
jgi:tripartite-type tricarboxylate transporter receptor subunit TctC